MMNIQSLEKIAEMQIALVKSRVDVDEMQEAMIGITAMLIEARSAVARINKSAREQDTIFDQAPLRQ